MYDTGYAGEDPHGGGSGEGGEIAALLQMGAMLYEGHQNRKVAKRNVDMTIAANKAEAELAYQRLVEMWNRQNLYNTPEAQMQRYKAAGLNPHLIYGQGTPGNAQGFPQYSPPNIRYDYESAHSGKAIAGLLPTLMAVGSWMQNMRLQQAELRQKTVGAEKTATDTERVRQMIDYLREQNPKLLEQMDKRLSLFPYQRSMMDYQSNIARTKLFELEQDFRQQYGEGLFQDMGSAWEPRGGKFSDIGGIKRLQFLEEQSKQKLLDAKASWSEFDVTDPQAIMMLVLNGVMGLAGQTLRLSTHRGGKSTHEVENRMSTGRTTIRRRIYEK